MGGINEDFVIANLICHAGGAGIRNRSSIVCDGFAGCFIGDTASIHHALHFRTVSNLGGYRFTGCIDKFTCIIGDSAVLCGIGDIICILFDGGLIIPLFYTHQDFLEVLSDVGLIQDFAAVILKRNLGVCSIRSAVFHIGLISFYNRIGNFILVIRILGQYTGCCIFRVVPFVIQCLADFVGPHFDSGTGIIIGYIFFPAVFIKGGFRSPGNALVHFQVLGSHIASVDFGVVVFIQSALQRIGIEFARNFQIFGGQFARYIGVPIHMECFRFDVFHTGQLALFQGCRAVGDFGPLQGSRSRYVFRRHIAGESTIFGTEVAGESAVLGTEITGERCIFRSDIAAEGCVFGVKIALGLDRSGPGIQAGHGGIATGVYREFAVGPFNLAVGAHGCLGCVKGIPAGVDTVFIHHRAVCTNLDSIFVQGDLVVLALVQDHFLGIGLGGGHVALGVNGSGVLLQNIVIAQAQSAIDSFHQFRICCHTGRSFCRNLIIQCRIGCCPFLGFLEICIVQSSESISHVLVDGIESIYHILVDLLNHLVLGFICSKAVGRFLCQGGVQVGHVFANGVGCFHDGPILNCSVILAHILVRCLFFQIFLHIGDPGIQRCIAGFTSSRFRIQVILQLIRGFVDRIGFVGNPFIQFVVSCFAGCFFSSYLPIGVSGRFFFHRIHFAVGFGLGVDIRSIGFRCHCIRIGLYLGIENRKVRTNAIGLDHIVSGLRRIIINSFCFYFPCYLCITGSGDIPGGNRTGSQLATNLHIFDSLVFFGPYNQIAILGNMQSRICFILSQLIVNCRISCFTACHFVVVGSSQRCNAIGCVLVHLLDDCILCFISTDPGGSFFGQGGVQVGHVFADGVGCFHDGPILYGGIILAHILVRSLFFQIFLHIGDPGIQFLIAGFDFIMDSVGFVRDAFVQFIIFSFPGCSFSGIRLFQISHGVFPFPCFFINSIRIGFNLCIQAAQVFPYRIILFDISSVFGSLVGHTVRSHFTCYSYITRRSDITGRNASGSQFSTDFHIFDCLIFFSAYN